MGLLERRGFRVDARGALEDLDDGLGAVDLEDLPAAVGAVAEAHVDDLGVHGFLFCFGVFWGQKVVEVEKIKEDGKMVEVATLFSRSQKVPNHWFNSFSFSLLVP